MRIYRISYDMIICILFAWFASWAGGRLTEPLFAKSYVSYVEEHTVEDGQVGGKAGAELFRAKSVDDILSHDRFTIEAGLSEFRNNGGGYYGKNSYYYLLELPSGEYVAADINMDSAVPVDDSQFYGDYILPVGRIVYEDLTVDEMFMQQIEYSIPLSRTDFYIDMRAHGGTMSEERYIELKTAKVKFYVAIISFIVCHVIGSKIGLFPTYIRFKKKPESEWE